MVSLSRRRAADASQRPSPAPSSERSLSLVPVPCALTATIFRFRSGFQKRRETTPLTISPSVPAEVRLCCRYTDDRRQTKSRLPCGGAIAFFQDHAGRFADLHAHTTVAEGAALVRIIQEQAGKTLQCQIQKRFKTDHDGASDSFLRDQIRRHDKRVRTRNAGHAEGHGQAANAVLPGDHVGHLAGPRLLRQTIGGDSMPGFRRTDSVNSCSLRMKMPPVVPTSRADSRNF